MFGTFKSKLATVGCTEASEDTFWKVLEDAETIRSQYTDKLDVMGIFLCYLDKDYHAKTYRKLVSQLSFRDPATGSDNKPDNVFYKAAKNGFTSEKMLNDYAVAAIALYAPILYNGFETEYITYAEKNETNKPIYLGDITLPDKPGSVLPIIKVSDLTITFTGLVDALAVDMTLPVEARRRDFHNNIARLMNKAGIYQGITVERFLEVTSDLQACGYEYTDCLPNMIELICLDVVRRYGRQLVKDDEGTGYKLNQYTINSIRLLESTYLGSLLPQLFNFYNDINSICRDSYTPITSASYPN